MVDMDQGLTKTYNALKDPNCTEARILELRQLHEGMDHAVLAAYGWSDLVVPPYCSLSDADRNALKAFEDAVIDRLFELNAQRATEERVLGAGSATKKGKHANRVAPKTSKGSTKPGQPSLPGVEPSDV